MMSRSKQFSTQEAGVAPIKTKRLATASTAFVAVAIGLSALWWFYYVVQVATGH